MPSAFVKTWHRISTFGTGLPPTALIAIAVCMPFGLLALVIAGRIWTDVSLSHVTSVDANYYLLDEEKLPATVTNVSLRRYFTNDVELRFSAPDIAAIAWAEALARRGRLEPIAHDHFSGGLDYGSFEFAERPNVNGALRQRLSKNVRGYTGDDGQWTRSILVDLDEHAVYYRRLGGRARSIELPADRR